MFYLYIEFLFSFDFFVVGGGVFKNVGDFLLLFDFKILIVLVIYCNNLGIIGVVLFVGD